MNHAPRPLASLLPALLVAVGLAACLEWLDLQLLRSAPSLGPLDRALLLLGIAGGCALGGLALLLVEAASWLGLRRLARPALEAARRLDRRVCADGLAGLLVFAVVAWLSEYAFELFLIRHAYDRVDEVALLFSTLHLLLTLPLLALSLVAGALLRRRLLPGEGRLRGLATGSLAAAALFGGWLVTRQAALLPPAVAALGACGVLGLLQAAVASSGRLPALSGPRQTLWLALVGATLLLVSGLVPAGSAVAREVLLGRPGLAAALVRGAAALTDLDGDGFPALLEASDCAPFDPSVHPLALDLPGDGLDANCSGRDAPAGAPSPFFALPSPGGRSPSGLRVVWVVIDSLRADRVANPGLPYPRRLTPHLDALTGRGAFRFDSARAPAANTEDSLPAMLASRYPTLLARDGEAGTPAPTLASLLAARGYRTGLVTPIGDHAEGARRGFEVVEDSLSHRKNYIYGVTSINVTEIAASLVQSWRHEPFLLVVHYFDPHGAYIAHRDFYFGDSDVDRYDSEVALTDMACGALLDLLAGNGLLEDTIVVVSADHGEAFGEHGRIAHGGMLYEEVVRVPLLLLVPGMSGRPVAEPVSLLDLAPTLLDLLGVPDPGGLQGRSLVPLLRGEPWPPVPLFFDTQWAPRTHLRGVLAGGWKYSLELTTGVERLFDLRTDPGERRNLADAAPDVAATLRAAVGDLQDRRLGVTALRGAPQ